LAAEGRRDQLPKAAVFKLGRRKIAQKAQKIHREDGGCSNRSGIVLTVFMFLRLLSILAAIPFSVSKLSVALHFFCNSKLHLMQDFELVSDYAPAGDQPAAIEKLVSGIKEGKRDQVLLGVTGSGKTFTMANVIAQMNRPTLILSHNKTLAAQLYGEFKEFFPNNAVSYFVSYYDYYQPEAYIPARDIYIEKDSSINEEIDRLRLLATSALVSRRDVIVVASVSCIYGLGSPKDYLEMMVPLQIGDEIDRDKLLLKLVDIHYERNDYELARAKFRARGDVIEVWPAYEEFAFRIELWGDEVENLSIINPLTGEEAKKLNEIYIYPAKHFVMPMDRIEAAVLLIEAELHERLEFFKKEGKLLEAQRLQARTRYDIELLRETGFCPGIENYSRALADRKPGEPPYTLLDFFPEDSLLMIDESHVTIPQIRAMWAGDNSRKTTLVEHGFRLPMALDNRPLKFDEFIKRPGQRLLVSATPADWELEQTKGEIVEQVIRPTGLVDPEIYIVPARGQVPHLMDQIRERAEAGERVLVTALTKRLSEDLTAYMLEEGIRCKWLHSELDAIERVEILRELREGKFDACVGVNLLREGLDLPEVSLVAILDADKEGFLRSATSLIQTIGRSARNVNAKVILYADKVTNSMQQAIDETDRRREIQLAYNEANGITPETIQKAIRKGIEEEIAAHNLVQETSGGNETYYVTQEFINELEGEMMKAAEGLEFERAAQLRDRIMQLKQQIGQEVPLSDSEPAKTQSKKSRRGRKGSGRGGRVPKPEKPA
jgi:excinuclease ABC subunit B